VSGDALEQLLKAADASATAPAHADGLPARVRRRLRVRRRNRFALAVAAVALAPLLALALSLRDSAPPAQVALELSEPTVTRHDLAQLDAQAALHEQTVTRLLAAGKSDVTGVVAPGTQNPVLANVREQRDRAALVLVYEAEQAARDKQNDRALAAYRRAIELFPTSRWAAVARQRLKEMPT
jgi:hypothetical protein